jgi:hypothetical protein
MSAEACIASEAWRKLEARASLVAVATLDVQLGNGFLQ